MKFKRLLYGAILMSFSTLSFASSLNPEQCTIGDRPFDRPLDVVGMSFDGGIELSGNAVAYVTHGNEKVAGAVSFEIKNYTTDKRTQGWLYIYFSGECLPKGKEYALHLDSGSIRLLDDREITNDEIAYLFEIPSDLGDPYFSVYDNGGTIVSTDCISCSWNHEAVAIGNPEWELYREGELVRKYPAEISSDWDLGSAFLNFGEDIHFENGVRYRLVLPEGSVCTHRSDIINKEVTFDFIGGYADPIQYPDYYWCSLFSEIPDTITEVSFYFNIPIELIPGKPVIFSEEYQPVNKKWEAIPTLSNDGSKWILAADFGGIELENEKVYSIEIPEGTIVTAEGDIAVNRKRSISCGISGLSKTKVTDCSISVAGNSIDITGIEPGNPVNMFDSAGKAIKVIPNPGDSVRIDVDNKGAYIVSVGNKAFKIVVL